MESINAKSWWLYKLVAFLVVILLVERKTKVDTPAYSLICDSHEPTSATQIAALENEVGLEFPDSYKTFLLKHNGGSFRPNVTYRGEHKEHGLVNVFLPLSAFDGNDIFGTLKIPGRGGYLPIAHCETGDIFYLRLIDDEKRNAMCLVGPDGQRKYIADSFEEWFARFEFSPPEYKSAENPFPLLADSNFEQLKTEFTESWLTIQNDDGRTFLQEAIFGSHYLATDWLLEKMPQLKEEVDSEGRSLLHWAVNSQSVDMVQLLLNKKISIDRADNFGRTPLITAVRCSANRSARLLISSKAKRNLKDVEGKSAADHCINWSSRTFVLPLLID